MSRYVAISAGLGEPSTTRMLADSIAASVRRQDPEASIEVIGLRDLAHDVVDSTLMGFASPRLQQVIDRVIAADGLIAIAPIYKGSYPGLFKSFFDGLESDALTGKPVLVAATGGTARHSLAIDFAMRPLFSHLQTLIVPTGVFASPHDWAGAGESALTERIDRATSELLSLVGGSGTGRGPEEDIDLFSETMLSISDPNA